MEYKLQLIDKNAIASDQINVQSVQISRYKQYPTSSTGTVIIDENTDLTNMRRLISTYTFRLPNDSSLILDSGFSELFNNGKAPRILTNTAGVNSDAQILTDALSSNIALGIASTRPSISYDYSTIYNNVFHEFWVNYNHNNSIIISSNPYGTTTYTYISYPLTALKNILHFTGTATGLYGRAAADNYYIHITGTSLEQSGITPTAILAALQY